MPSDSPEETWKPENSIIDTALQILKITEYANTYDEDEDYLGEDSERVQSLLTRVFVSWLQNLNKLDFRDQYAWPHAREDGANTFRLEEHFWAWKALKAMEDQGISSKLPSPTTAAEQSRPRTVDDEKKKRQEEEFLKRVGGKDEFRKMLLASNKSPVRDYKSLPQYKVFHLISRRLASNEVLRGVLQRFTTTNDILSMVSYHILPR